MNEIDWKARADAAEAREAVLREALEWALAEVEGRTRYSAPGQRDACLARAHAATTSASAAARDARIRAEGRRALVEDAMTSLHMAPMEGETPERALRRLIGVEQLIALDPEVSAGAQGLVARGRREGIEEMVAALQKAASLKDDGEQKDRLLGWIERFRELAARPAGEARDA